MHDLPRDKLIEQAIAIRTQCGPERTDVYFKFTCQYCKERCTLQEANTIFKIGKCDACGGETAIIKGGLMIVMRVL